MVKIIISICLSAIIVGCGTKGLTQDEREALYADYVKNNKLEKVDRVTSFKFHGWSSLDNHHLIITSHFNRPHFVKLKSTCIDLKWSHGIVIHKSSSNTLNAKFDSISPLKFPKQKCFIAEMYKISKEQAKEITKLGKEES